MLMDQDLDIATGLHFNTPIQVAGGGGGGSRAGLAPICTISSRFSPSPSMVMKYLCFAKTRGLANPSLAIFEVSSSSAASEISSRTLWMPTCFRYVSLKGDWRD